MKFFSIILVFSFSLVSVSSSVRAMSFREEYVLPGFGSSIDAVTVGMGGVSAAVPGFTVGNPALLAGTDAVGVSLSGDHLRSVGDFVQGGATLGLKIPVTKGAFQIRYGESSSGGMKTLYTIRRPGGYDGDVSLETHEKAFDVLYGVRMAESVFSSNDRIDAGIGYGRNESGLDERSVYCSPPTYCPVRLKRFESRQDRFILGAVYRSGSFRISSMGILSRNRDTAENVIYYGVRRAVSEASLFRAGAAWKWQSGEVGLEVDHRHGYGESRTNVKVGLEQSIWRDSLSLLAGYNGYGPTVGVRARIKDFDAALSYERDAFGERNTYPLNERGDRIIATIQKTF